jgi:uncharacterized protein (TIGR02284 family)
MNDIKKYTIEVLQELIDTNRDEYILFESASQKSEDAELKSLFAVYTGKKDEYISNLEKEIRRLGGYFGANKNELKNSFESYNSFLFEQTRDNMIAEFLKKGDLTINKYFHAIKKNIMWEVVPLIAMQYFGLKTLHDQIKNSFIERSGRLSHRMEIH